MSRKCEVCGKGQTSGNAVSHSNRHTRRKWNANIQTVRVNPGEYPPREVALSRPVRHQGELAAVLESVARTRIGRLVVVPVEEDLEIIVVPTRTRHGPRLAVIRHNLVVPHRRHDLNAVDVPPKLKLKGAVRRVFCTAVFIIPHAILRRNRDEFRMGQRTAGATIGKMERRTSGNDQGRLPFSRSWAYYNTLKMRRKSASVSPVPDGRQSPSAKSVSATSPP